MQRTLSPGLVMEHFDEFLFSSGDLSRLKTADWWRHHNDVTSVLKWILEKQVQLIKHLKVKLMSCILDEKVWVWGLIWPPWRKSMILYPRFIHRFISLLKYDFYPYDNPVGLFVWKWPSIGRPRIRPAKLFADLLLSQHFWFMIIPMIFEPL